VKKPSSVAGLLLASAMLIVLTGCRQIQMQRCVDGHNIVVDDSFCENPPTPHPNNNVHPNTLYRYYYGGAGTYYPGSVATGGNYAPTPAQAYATSRGGFNSGRGGRK
jgi:hypothetical protein